jgi:hypothetical protein
MGLLYLFLPNIIIISKAVINQLLIQLTKQSGINKITITMHLLTLDAKRPVVDMGSK